MREGKNGGKLLSGNPGNRGGLGAVPTAVRAEAREGFRRVIPRLIAIANGEDVEQTAVVSQGAQSGSEIEHFDAPAKIADQVGAAKVLAQVGMSNAISTDDVRARLELQYAMVREMIPDQELAEALIARLGAQVWK